MELSMTHDFVSMSHASHMTVTSYQSLSHNIIFPFHCPSQVTVLPCPSSCHITVFLCHPPFIWLCLHVAVNVTLLCLHSITSQISISPCQCLSHRDVPPCQTPITWLWLHVTLQSYECASMSHFSHMTVTPCDSPSLLSVHVYPLDSVCSCLASHPYLS